MKVGGGAPLAAHVKVKDWPVKATLFVSPVVMVGGTTVEEEEEEEEEEKKKEEEKEEDSNEPFCHLLHPWYLVL